MKISFAFLLRSERMLLKCSLTLENLPAANLSGDGDCASCVLTALEVLRSPVVARDNQTTLAVTRMAVPQ